MNIHISVYADENEAKLTGICFDTNVGTGDINEHNRIMDLVKTVATELVEGLQDIIDNPVFEEPDIPLDGPIYPSPIDPDEPIDEQPIPTPRPVNPPVYDK